jgi:hypothetical protein
VRTQIAPTREPPPADFPRDTASDGALKAAWQGFFPAIGGHEHKPRRRDHDGGSHAERRPHAHKPPEGLAAPGRQAAPAVNGTPVKAERAPAMSSLEEAALGILKGKADTNDDVRGAHNLLGRLLNQKEWKLSIEEADVVARAASNTPNSDEVAKHFLTAAADLMSPKHPVDPQQRAHNAATAQSYVQAAITATHEEKSTLRSFAEWFGLPPTGQYDKLDGIVRGMVAAGSGLSWPMVNALFARSGHIPPEN